MQRVRRRDTPAEVALRRLLFAKGLRYRVDSRPMPWLRGRADIVIKKYRLAVFVDGCFWHGCPLHGTMPRSNEGFWREKLAATKERDRAFAERLRAEGWTVMRFWEHADLNAAAKSVLDFINRRRC